MRALFRRAHQADEPQVEVLDFGDLVIDISGHKILVEGKEVDLTASEFKLLTTLARHPGRVYNRMELVEKVLGYDFEGYERTIDSHVKNLRAKLGDRACLRAVHYWYENGLVDKRWAALNAGDIDQFLVLTRESGASSAMYLQNVVAKLGSEQPSMYALALAEHVLDGRGAVRIHGGGFGGTIQAFVPNDRLEAFRSGMEALLGRGKCHILHIRPQGGTVVIG